MHGVRMLFRSPHHQQYTHEGHPVEIDQIEGYPQQAASRHGGNELRVQLSYDGGLTLVDGLHAPSPAPTRGVLGRSNPHKKRAIPYRRGYQRRGTDPKHSTAGEAPVQH